MNGSTDDVTNGFSIRRELSGMLPETRQAYEFYLHSLSALMSQTSPYVLRDDSRLAFRFAGGQMNHWSPYAVVHEMACTQYICDTLPYQCTSQPYLRALAAQLRESTGADWKHVWTAVAEMGPEMLKTQLMHQYGRMQLPDFAPAPPPGM